MTQRYNVNVPGDTTLTTTDEVVVATLPGVSVARPGSSIRLHGEFTVQSGAGTTGYTIRVRRNSLVGPVVDEPQTPGAEVAAGGVEDHDIVVTDVNPGELANATYVLTVSQTAAAANGTVTHASLEATVEP